MCGNDIPRRLVVRIRDDEPFGRYDAPVPVVPQPWIRFRPSKDLTYTRSIGRGRYGTYLPAVASRFPDLLPRHDAVDLRARYAPTLRTVLELHYYLEDYGASDWAFDGWGWAAARNLISFDGDLPDHGDGLFGVSVATRL